ncbi:HBL/NHE enterotoxin family protein [Bacillus thuringiensis]|uniref:HBL/NHE enterotoxin family protein n=1 Tax=Bacillus thuringiensis TaxID=1428 RepID=UPI003BF6AE12
MSSTNYLSKKLFNLGMDGNEDLRPNGLLNNNNDNKQPASELVPALNSKDFFTVNQYVADGLVLPLNEGAMRTYLSISTDVTMPDAFKPIYPLYTAIQSSTQNYRTNTAGQITEHIGELAAFANTTKATFNYLGKTVLPDALNGNKDAVQTFQTGLNDLLQSIQSIQDTASDLAKKVTEFQTDTATQQNEMQELNTQLQNAYGANSDAVKQIQAEIQGVNADIKAIIDEMTNLEVAEEWVALIPFVGWVADAVLEAFKAHDQGKLDDLTRKLEEDQKILQRDLAVGGLLQKVTHQSTSLAAEAGSAAVALGVISSSLGTIGNAIHNASKYGEAELKDPAINSALAMHLSIASAEWDTVAQLLLEFETVAGIQPPSSRDADANERKIPRRPRCCC